ncbi:MAG: CPBP family intramembrane glutamic endopeptidase [Bacillota bacterium]
MRSRARKRTRNPGPIEYAFTVGTVALVGYAMGLARPPTLLYLSGALFLASLATLLPQVRPFRGVATALLGLCLGLYLAALTIPAALPAAISNARPEIANAAFKAVWIMTAVLVALIAGWRLRDLGAGWGRISAAWWAQGAAMAAAFLVFYRYLYRPPAPLVTNLPGYWPYAAGICIFFGISNAMAEEYLFRRLAQVQLIDYLGPAWGLVAQALLYGLIHLGPSSRPSGPAGALVMTALGWFLGRSAYRTGGLALAVAVHALIDAFIFWWS